MNRTRTVDIVGFAMTVAMATGVFVLWLHASPAEPARHAPTHEPPGYTPVFQAEGPLRIAGSETMYPLMTYLAEGFRRVHPRIDMHVAGRGSRTGHRALLSGVADVATSSERWSAAQRAAFRERFGYDAREFLVGYDALVILVHPRNPLESVSLEMARRLLFDLAGHVQTWESATAGAYHLPVTRVVRNSSSGTHESLANLLDLPDHTGYAEPYSVMPGHAAILNAVRNNPGAIGYASLGWHDPRTKTLAIENEDGTVVPAEKSHIVDGAYPLRRQLYLYTHPENDKADWRSATEFLHYVSSDQGRRHLDQAGLFPAEAP